MAELSDREKALLAEPGRIFVGPLSGGGHPTMFTVKSVRRRKDGTASSATCIYDSRGVGDTAMFAEAKLSLPHDGVMRGFRRVELAHVATARGVANNVGSKVPTDTLVIVTRERVVGEMFG